MIIKLAVKNIKNSISEYRKVYLLLIVSQLVAVISIFFLYGIYGSYSAKMQELNIDSYEIGAYFTDSNMGNLRACLPKILDEMEEQLDYVYVAGAWDGTMISIYSEYYNGTFHLARTVAGRTKIETGRYISDEDIVKGNQVLYSQCRDKVGTVIEIGGTDFEVIGVDERTPGDVLIPLTSCSDNVKVLFIIANFKTLPTQKNYLAFKNELEEIFGEKVSVDEFEIKDKEELISVRSVIVITIAVGIISALNTCLLYGYIISRRRKQMAVYGIIGASKGLRLAINEIEIVIISVIIEIVAFAIYRFGLQDIITSVYENSVELYGAGAYIIMLLVYIICIVAITFIMLSIMNRQKLVDMIRRYKND